MANKEYNKFKVRVYNSGFDTIQHLSEVSGVPYQTIRMWGARKFPTEASSPALARIMKFLREKEKSNAN